MPLTLALAGRPNVGKSTLFNRLIGKAMAMVDDRPGVTRDWREGKGHLVDLSFRVLDLAGLEDEAPQGSLAARLTAQTEAVLRQADIVLVIVDGLAGVRPDDKAVARRVRVLGKPTLVLVNKCESPRLPPGYHEAEALGFPDVLPISALHGEGLADLAAALRPYVRAAAKTEPSEAGEDVEAFEDDSGREDESEDVDVPKALNLALIGRPNAGKSTLVNRLLGQERVLTGPEAGLTRESIATVWTYHQQTFRLIDTAGLRRRARRDGELETMSAEETLRAIRLAHVVVLVMDAQAPFDKQDYTLAQHVIKEGRALVIALNKWDATDRKPETLRLVKAKIVASLAQAEGVPLVTLSALKGSGCDTLMDAVMRAFTVWNLRVSTGALNRWLEDVENENPPPLTEGRRIKLRYATQVKARPPTFALWVNKPVELPESYMRFLTGRLRAKFGLPGVPIRWLLRKSANPYTRPEGSPSRRRT